MKRVIAFTLLAASSAFAQVSIGIQIGAPPPPRVEVRPVAPAAEFVWIEGYWYPVGNHYKWHPGYWSRPPYAGAVWIAPHHDGARYFDGYWEGERGHWAHDHHWDHDRGRRDFDRDWDRDHDRGRHDFDRDHDHDRH